MHGIAANVALLQSHNGVNTMEPGSFTWLETSVLPIHFAHTSGLTIIAMGKIETVYLVTSDRNADHKYFSSAIT